MLETINNLYDKQIVLARDFNFFSDTSLDSYGGKPTLKNKYIAKLIELKEKIDLCDISRIRNRKTKRYTFSQKHVLIQTKTFRVPKVLFCSFFFFFFLDKLK